MKTYHPGVGTHISDACAGLVAFAQEHGEPAEMSFNDETIVAEPNDSADGLVSRFHTASEMRAQQWRNSAAGVAEAQRRSEDIARKQSAIDTLLKNWPVVQPLGWSVVMSWAEALTENADDIGVKLDHRALAATLEASGYEENSGVGQKPEWFNTPERLGGYIMGQVINCLKSGMPPHQVIGGFIERFRRAFCTVPNS